MSWVKRCFLSRLYSAPILFELFKWTVEQELLKIDMKVSS